RGGARPCVPRVTRSELHHRHRARNLRRRFVLHIIGMSSTMSVARDTRSSGAPVQCADAEMPVGDLVARYLADIGVTTVFGVISIHNRPTLAAISRQQRIRCVPARGEAGATNMADAAARVSRGLGVVITSTGTAAGNAAGSQVEALTAGSPILHITSQIDRPFLDRDPAAIPAPPAPPRM